MSGDANPRRRGHAKNRNRGPKPSNTPKDASEVERAELELTSGRHRDFRTFAESYLQIQTKRGSFQHLRLNKSQEFRECLLEEMEEAGVPLWVWEAKARQLGCSTHIQGRMAHRCFTNRDKSALIAAHESGPAEEIFKKIKLFYDNMPSGMKPLQKYNNRAELDLRAPSGPYGLRSKVSIVTARNKESARGVTARHIHLSELAFYPDPEGFLLGTLQTAPGLPGTMVYVESTCRGAGDYHHTQYLAARVWWQDENGDPDPPPWMKLKQRHPGNPDNKFYALFTPWFLMDEYQSPLRLTEQQFKLSFDPLEQRLWEEFSEYLTLEHLQWRRETIAAKCGGSVKRFQQEYPATDEEAFAHTGMLAFDRDGVARQERKHSCYCSVCRPSTGEPSPPDNDCPPHQFYELYDGSISDDSRRRVWRQMTPQLVEMSPGEGRLSVWRQPIRGRRYVVWADVSKGAIGSDFDHAVVMDVGNFEQVAEWRGQLRQDEYATVLILLSMFYNDALLAAEVTGVGAGLAVMLEQSHYPYLYKRSTQASGYGRGPQSLVTGWSTDAATKPAMVTNMDSGIKHDELKIRSRIGITEMGAYRMMVLHSPDGAESNRARWGAPKGKHDDACMALMGAFLLAKYQPGAGRKGLVPTVRDMGRPHDEWTEADWKKYERQLRREARARSGVRRQ